MMQIKGKQAQERGVGKWARNREVAARPEMGNMER